MSHRTVSQNEFLTGRTRYIHTWTLPGKNDPTTTSSSYTEMRILSLALIFSLVRQRDLTAAVSRLPDFSDLQRLFCPNPLPGPDWIFGNLQEDWRMLSIRIELGLPAPTWSSKNFTSLEDLCSSRGNPQTNMGGKV